MTTATTDPTEATLKVRARNDAQKMLQQAYPEEWEKMLEKSFANHGLTRKPRRSGEEKARLELENIRAKFPHLLEVGK